jgi:hypothetical protein
MRNPMVPIRDIMLTLVLIDCRKNILDGSITDEVDNRGSGSLTINDSRLPQDSEVLRHDRLLQLKA